MAARVEEHAAASNRNADETMSRTAAADQKTDEAIARTAALIRNQTAEWNEERNKFYALLNSIYDALENGEIESDSDDEDGGAAAAERSRRLWDGVDLSGINKGDGEYAIAVYPPGVYPQQEEEGHDAAAPAPAAE